MSSSLKTKINSSKVNFSKNIFTSIIIPVAFVVLAVIFGFVFGFNQGMDFKGGIQVSIVAENQNLEEESTYKTFKNKVDNVLQANGVSGSIYLTETEATTYNNVLVVKINYSKDDAKQKIELIEKGLKENFFKTTDQEDIDLRNLISVTTFEGSVNSEYIVFSILASLVATILMCSYIFAREGFYASMLSLLGAIVSNILTWALIMVFRVPTNRETLSVIPFVAIASIIATWVFVRKSKKLLTNTENFNSKSNYELANETIKSNLYGTIITTSIVCVALLLFSLFNVCSPVIFFGLALLLGVVSTTYTNLYILPAIFGATYVRKIKKVKEKKQKQQDALTQEEVMKETDLDNLVSN